MLLVRAALLTALLGAALSCGNGTDTAGAPAPGLEPAPRPPAENLAERAAKASTATYTADYEATGSHITAPTTVKVTLTPGGYRFDVATGGTTSVLLRTAAGTVACQVGAATACFDVAGPGQPVPGLYDPGIEALFTTNLEQLARRSYGYEVRDGGPFSVADVQGHCFVIVARENAPKPVVDDGTYCLSDSGMPLSVQYSAGKLTLTKVGDPPTEAQLQPPSAPTPLPSA